MHYAKVELNRRKRYMLMSFLLHNIKIKATLLFRLIVEHILTSLFLIIICCFLLAIFISNGDIGYFLLFNFHLGLIIHIHIKRQDIISLKSILSRNYKKLIFTEYLFISIPFIILYLLAGGYFKVYALLSLKFCFLLAFGRFFFLKGKIIIPYFLNKESFEWILFIRHGIAYYLLGVIVLFGCTYFVDVEIEIILITFIILLVLIISLIYSISEPTHYILINRYTAKNFLIKKILLSLLNYSLFCIPIFIMIFLHFNSVSHFWVIVYFSSLVCIINIISIKYAFFDSGFILKTLLGIQLGLFITIIFNPATSIALFLGAPYFINKAIKNIKSLMEC
jgi:hypothetical protein